MAQIVIRNLRKEFGDFTAVRESSFTIEDGEFFMLLGPSGCGKTTTLRMIAGLELPTGGEILLDGEEISRKPPSERDIAFVFQMFALYPHMNVRRNISYPLVSQGMPRAQVRAKVAEAARILGIEDILDRPVGGLSGGDRQRVALGRAIVREPKAFMMDEPLGALDAEFREHMAGELRALHDRMGATTVYVTHDQLEAMQMGDKIVVMNNAVVEQFGTPQEIYDKPATLFVANFIGSPPMNFLNFSSTLAPGEAQVSLGNHDAAMPALREGAAGDLVFGVRPEHVRFDDHSVFRARVLAAEYLGTTQIVTLDSAHGEIKARVDSRHRVRADETVGLSFRPDTVTLFDRATGRALRSALNEGGRFMAEVVLDGIAKAYGATPAVVDITMTIPDGAFVVLLGPTGAGKTTTLRLISGLERLDKGAIRIAGRDVGRETPAQRDVAMVFQQYSLYPHMTVRDNLAFPLRSPILRTPEEEIARKVHEIAEILQIPHKLGNKATELSGGEMQRVSIGRALVRDPAIHLMDEPLSSLDAKLRADLRVELKRIQADLGSTLLYVNHDQIEAMTMATHIGVLEAGRLVQYGTPREIYENPRSVYVASRLGLPRINILPSALFGGDHKGPQIGLRPEHIRQGDGVEARVVRAEHLGDQTRLHLDLQGHAVITLTDPHRDYTPDDRLKISPSNPLYFDASGARVA